MNNQTLNVKPVGVSAPKTEDYPPYQCTCKSRSFIRLCDSILADHDIYRCTSCGQDWFNRPDLKKK